MAEVENNFYTIGRAFEVQKMRSFFDNSTSELVAMIGRRRVGKTFLIKNVYKKEMAFYITGIQNVSRSMQLDNFTSARNDYFPNSISYEKPTNWLHAFAQLKQLLGKSKKKNVFYFLMNCLGWLTIQVNF